MSTVKEALKIVKGRAADTPSAQQMRLFVERVERLEAEKQALADDIKDVFAEAKATGFDTPTLRAIVRLRKLESHVLQEKKALLETYGNALGMQLTLL